MVARLAVPKQAAMEGNVGAVARVAGWWLQQMAAVVEQDADGVEQGCDVTRAWGWRADPVADREARRDRV